MSLKVAVGIQVTQMNGAEVVNITRIDTAINPNPADPTAEAALASEMVGRIAAEQVGEAQERLAEYNQSLARLLAQQQLRS